MEHDTRAAFVWTVAVSWERLDHFDGVLVRVHTLSEGARRFRQYQHCINPAVGALYHHVTHLPYVIRRMVSNMYVLQLVAVAGVARHLNAYITVAHRSKSPSARKLCQTHQHPFSVIQAI